MLVSASDHHGLLKREVLLFNKIALPRLESFLNDDRTNLSDLGRENFATLDYLTEQGIIFDPNESVLHALGEGQLAFNNKEKSIGESYLEHLSRMREMGTIDETDSRWYEYSFHGYAGYQLEARIASIVLRKAYNIDSYPIIAFPLTRDAVSDNDHTVIEVVIKALPTPDALTSWEDIVSFRSNAGSWNKFLDLRNWMTDVSRAKLSYIEIEQKLEYLISQYQRHLELHRMRVHRGFFEAVVVSGAEIAEELIKFKWGKLAQELFSIRKSKIALLEGELSSPGSEVAYILTAQNTFSDKARGN